MVILLIKGGGAWRRMGRVKKAISSHLTTNDHFAYFIGDSMESITH